MRRFARSALLAKDLAELAFVLVLSMAAEVKL
jgi:hypothetical protein